MTDARTLSRLTRASAGPWAAGTALLALSLVRGPLESRRSPLLRWVRMLPRWSKPWAVLLSALVITILTVTPYSHAPRDMPMIVGQDACGCSAPVLYSLSSHLSCRQQDGGIDPFDRILLAKGLGDVTAITEYILSYHSARHLACQMRTYARAIGSKPRRAARAGGEIMTMRRMRRVWARMMPLSICPGIALVAALSHRRHIDSVLALCARGRPAIG